MITRSYYYLQFDNIEDSEKIYYGKWETLQKEEALELVRDLKLQSEYDAKIIHGEVSITEKEVE
jgi:hypothetical protein